MPIMIALFGMVAAHAAPALVTVQDVLYKADGSRFNGTVELSWVTFLSSESAPIPTQAVRVSVVNGAFRAKLVPTTTSSAGAYYQVKYLSEGMYQYTEKWAVPPSGNSLKVRDVRVATGVVVGPTVAGQSVLISDIPGLSDELSARAPKGTAYAPQRAAVINSSGQLDAAAGNLTDCLHVDGSSGPCGSGSSGSSQTGVMVQFADGETPNGAVDGVNTVFSLQGAPSPAASLTVFRNGILMKAGMDYTLSSNAITFAPVSIPQAGDMLTVSYRYPSITFVSVHFVDGETPTGTIDGVNAQFSLSTAPSPASSLALYNNGVLLKAGADFTIAGTSVTFVASTVPQPADTLQAFYRY